MQIAGSRLTLAIDGEGKVRPFVILKPTATGLNAQRPPKPAHMQSIAYNQLRCAGPFLGLECTKLVGSWSQVQMQAQVFPAQDSAELLLSLHRATEKKPRRIAALKGVNVVQAACGGWHCLAVSNTGQAYAWGGNEYGQCGVAQGRRDVPEPTPCLPQHKVQQVAAGGMHTCAVTESGRVCSQLPTQSCGNTSLHH